MAQRITGVKATLKELKELEDGTLNALRRDIRKYLADDISNAYRYVQESEYKMVFGVRNAGMFHPGRTGFQTPTIKVGIRPRSKYGIVSIVATPPANGVGYEIMEKAGSKSSGYSKQGRAMIAMLQKTFPPNKAGRFVFASLLKRKKQIETDIALIIETYSRRVNARLSKGTELDIISKVGDIF